MTFPYFFYARLSLFLSFHGLGPLEMSLAREEYRLLSLLSVGLICCVKISFREVSATSGHQVMYARVSLPKNTAPQNLFAKPSY